jgi:ribosome-associated protein
LSERQSSEELACWISQLLDRKAGRGIFVLDVREISTITDFVVIASGTSSRHLETLIDAPCMELKQLGFPANAIEGKDTHWIVADFGDVILHVFDEGARQHFDLEGLWVNAPRVDWEKKDSGLRMIGK